MAKKTQKEIESLINGQTFLVQEPEKGEPVNPYMDVYKAKIQSDRSLDKIKLKIMVRGDMQNKELVGDAWSPTASMSNLKYLLADASNNKSIVHQLDLLGHSCKQKLRIGYL